MLFCGGIISSGELLEVIGKTSSHRPETCGQEQDGGRNPLLSNLLRKPAPAHIAKYQPYPHSSRASPASAAPCASGRVRAFKYQPSYPPVSPTPYRVINRSRWPAPHRQEPKGAGDECQVDP